jgi:hypothetical protein
MKNVTRYSAKSSLKTFMTLPVQHLLFLTGVAALLTGCAGVTPIEPTGAAGVTVRGTAFGGQQAVVGASMQLYAANLSGYGNPAIPLLPADSIKTDAGGGFNISGQYTCPLPDAPVYLVAIGGNSGLSPSNPNLALMAALGSCSALEANASNTFIQINEVTTVAAAYALAPFMTGVAGMSTSPGNTIGLNLAFADVTQLVNNATGTSPGTALPPGAVLPIAQLDSLADSLAACVNSTGGTAGDTSSCGKLFTAATPPEGTAPTDTVSAVINIVQHPGQNVAAIYALAAAITPFQPTLSTTPNDWTLAVTYTGGGGLSAPSAVAVDASGNVWITNRSTNTVSELDHSGAVLATSAAALSGPSAVALDAAGGPWIADRTGNTLTQLSAYGAGTGTASGGGLSLPAGLAIDPQGNLWVSNSGTASVSEFTSTGSPLSGNGFSGSGIINPLGIAISTHCDRTGPECTP